MRDPSGRTSNRRARYYTRSLLTLAYMFSSIACSRRADDCHYNLTCGDVDPPDSGTGSTSNSGGAPSTGGSAPAGGVSAGGTTGSGGIPATGGQSTAVDVCGGICEAEGKHCDPSLPQPQCVECRNGNDCLEAGKPLCDSSSHTCVQCTSSTDCGDAGKAVCDSSTHQCVECLVNTDCDANRPLCNGAHACVECLTTNDCQSATKPVCSSQGACTSCSTKNDCAHLNLNLCISAADAGATDTKCVECTEDTVSLCKGNTCNPATNKCTKTTLNSVPTCGACVTDADCSQSSPSRCVPMTFGGKSAGSYCLQLASSGCTQPFSTSLSAASVSNPNVVAFCGLDQAATTCPALVDFMAGTKTCNVNADCGLGMNDGVCGTVGSIGHKCSIPCGIGLNCLSTAPGNTCAGSPKYCQ